MLMDVCYCVVEIKSKVLIITFQDILKHHIYHFTILMTYVALWPSRIHSVNYEMHNIQNLSIYVDKVEAFIMVLTQLCKI